jgi:hypothetical protein
MNSTLPEKVEKVERAMCTFSEFVPTTGSTGPTPSHGRELLGLNPDPVGLATSTAMADEDEEDSRDESIAAAAGQHQLRDRNGKNSLAHLCRRFLMVLLCNPVSASGALFEGGQLLAYWLFVESSWGLVKPSWGLVEPSWALVEPSWGLVEPSWP